MKSLFIWNIWMCRPWSKRGIHWALMTAFQSAVSFGKSTTNFGSLNRGQKTRSSVGCFSRLRLFSLHYLTDSPRTGNIVRAPLYDRAFHVESMSEAGPFNTVQNFHDWFTFLHRKPMPDPYSVPIEPFRQDLPDDCVVIFTHGDLHRSNILITRSAPYHVVSIVDWEQSGWLPSYWEARKAQYTADRNDEWSKIYLPMILCQFTSTWDSWDYYTIAMGC